MKAGLQQDVFYFLDDEHGCGREQPHGAGEALFTEIHLGTTEMYLRTVLLKVFVKLKV